MLSFFSHVLGGFHMQTFTKTSDALFMAGMVITFAVVGIMMLAGAQGSTAGTAILIGFAASTFMGATASAVEFYQSVIAPKPVVTGWISGTVEEITAAAKAAEADQKPACTSYTGNDGRRYVNDFSVIQAQMASEREARATARAKMEERYAQAA
jgi:hypothetical protein